MSDELKKVQERAAELLLETVKEAIDSREEDRIELVKIPEDNKTLSVKITMDLGTEKILPVYLAKIIEDAATVGETSFENMMSFTKIAHEFMKSHADVEEEDLPFN